MQEGHMSTFYNFSEETNNLLSLKNIKENNLINSHHI